MKTAMVISPHADDAAAFCGGTLAKLAGQGWDVILVRVTDDRKDSVGLTVAETIQVNTAQLHQAAGILGIRTIIDLGFETDTLADVPLGQLRERMVYLFRKHKPYVVFSFDPFGLYEGNQDHTRTAQAVEEAFWVSCFDKHYPAHFAEGLAPFAVCEHWYFARQLPEINRFEDVTETMDVKILALSHHQEMMKNTINQTLLQLKTDGKSLPLLAEAMDGDLQPLVGMVIKQQGSAMALQAGWAGENRFAEGFRWTRYGELEDLVTNMAEPIKSDDR